MISDSERKKELERISGLGIVGAGGAGFPTGVKLNSKAEIIIANGAECEPLLHKDKELMAAAPATILDGIKKAMQLTGASRGIIAVKRKASEAVQALTPLVRPPISIHLLDDIYPAGDEIVWIPGYQPAHAFRLTEQAGQVILLRLERRTSTPEAT